MLYSGLGALIISWFLLALAVWRCEGAWRWIFGFTLGISLIATFFTFPVYIEQKLLLPLRLITFIMGFLALILVIINEIKEAL